MGSENVIVFGPTGAVASSAARTAGELGAKVVLAMRDTQKSIAGLSAEDEKSGNFSRVQADLTKPDTVRNAVSSTNAKRAFIYLAHGSPDHMKETIAALKSAGIELVVFLSSFTIQEDLASIPPSEMIPWMHAQVELQLQEIYGEDNFVALRPGYFASNTVAYKSGLQEGSVKIFKSDAKVDCIVPEDIGRVAGTVLAKGPQNAQRKIYLYGPDIISQREAVQTLAKVLGKSPHIEDINAQDAHKHFTSHGMPPPLADYMVRASERGSGAGEKQVFGHAVSEEELVNVEKYSGRKSTTFEKWVEQNKAIFVS